MNNQSSKSSEHSLDEFIDQLLSVAPDATVLIRMSLLGESFLGRVELEGPKEVVGYLEVRSHSGYLVDQILNTHNAVLLELAGNDGVVSQGDSGPIDLAEASLVDKLGDGLLRRVAVSNVWLDFSDHIDGCLVQSDEHSVVQLSQS